MRTVSTWRTVELEPHRTKDADNPYTDVNVTVTFTGPGGVEIRRPAFWDGRRTWKVRFAPTRPSAWAIRAGN
jgi:hypothetical protein